MKLYMHPVSMTSRPVRLFAADNKIAMDEELVDLMSGAHMQPAYAAIIRSLGRNSCARRGT